MGSLTFGTTGTISGLANNMQGNAIAAGLATMSQGATAPTAASTGLTSIAGLWWHDTGTNLVKLRDQADTAWIVIGSINETTKLFTAALDGPTITNGMTITGPAGGAARYVILETAGSPRWGMGIDSSPETGSNGGSNWHVPRYNDAGAWIDDPINISRATGVVAFAHTPTAPTPSPGDNSTNAASTAFVAAAVAAAMGAAPAALAHFSRLKIQVTGNAALTVFAATVGMCNAAGAGIAAALSATAGTGAAGLNGLDTGAVAASTWYYVWAVGNGTTAGVVLSTSSAAPNSAITATYPYYARIGAVRTNGSGNLLGTLQVGRRAQYVVGGPNVAGLPQMASGTAGSATTPTFVSVSTSSFVPPTAGAIDVGLVQPTIAAGYKAIVAPNGSYGNTSGSGGANFPPLMASGSGSSGSVSVVSRLMTLESANIYWASDHGAYVVQCHGWEDNL